MLPYGFLKPIANNDFYILCLIIPKVVVNQIFLCAPWNLLCNLSLLWAFYFLLELYFREHFDVWVEVGFLQRGFGQLPGEHCLLQGHPQINSPIQVFGNHRKSVHWTAKTYENCSVVMKSLHAGQRWRQEAPLLFPSEEQPSFPTYSFLKKILFIYF